MSRRHVGLQVVALGGLFCGCEIPPGEEAATEGSGTQAPATSGDASTSGGEGSGGAQLPMEGFRVYPKYMLQELPAIVTVAQADAQAEACPADASGGYLCDTSDLRGSRATIQVERDGFEPARREPMIVAGQLEELEVHLDIEGGSIAGWSACMPLGDVDSCTSLCASEQQTCAATSCATDDPQWPLATHRIFVDVDCVVASVPGAAAACDESLAEATKDGMAIQCCCDG